MYEKSVKFNNKEISSNILEVTAFPKSEIINSDIKKAYDINIRVFNQLIFEIHKICESSMTAIEFLWISEKVENQTFKSRVRVFVVVRKIGTNVSLLESDINAVQSTIITALNQSNFETKVFDLSDKTFIDMAKSIDCSNMFSIVKTEKVIGNSMSYGSYYTWDVLNNRSEDTLSGFISAMSQQQNCAVSFQIIPTKLTPTELTYLSELNAQYKQSVMMRDFSAEMPCNVTQYLLDRAQKPMFMYNICTFGSTEACRFISTKLLSLLQSGEEKIADCDLITLNLSAEKINIANHFYLYPWIINEKLIKKYRNHQLQQIPLVKVMGRLPYIMTGEELNVFFRLPLYDKSIPAINQKRETGSSEQLSKTVYDKENTIKIGNLISASGKDVYIGCPLKSWTQHALIVGMPGTGKTTFAVNILTQFINKGIPFLAIEPTKTEYRAMIDVVDDLQIFTPGNSSVSPFIINPFIPPKGITVEQYIPSLLGAFKAAFDMEGPLEMIFLKSVNACYIEYGWKQNSKYGDEDVTVFGLFEYILCFKKIMQTMDYSKETQSNIKTAGLLRLMNLIEQNSNIYDTVNTVPIEDLLTKPTVLELNAIENEEQKALVMALLLASACVHIKNNPSIDGSLKSVILIDEAHVLLDSGKDTESFGKSKGATVKTLQNMIAEIRSYGTGIIIADQKPSKVTDDVIDNTDVKVSFRLSSLKERSLIATSTNMSDNDAEYIAQLDKGQAFVHFGELKTQPLLVKTEDTRARDGIRLSVPNEEIVRRSTYWNDKKKKLIPFRECACSSACSSCSFKVRNDAEFFSAKLLNNCSSKITDKRALVNYAIRVPQALKKYVERYNEEELEQLYNCSIIKFLRKAELSMPYTLTLSEIKTIIEKSRDFIKGE